MKKPYRLNGRVLSIEGDDVEIGFRQDDNEQKGVEVLRFVAEMHNAGSYLWVKRKVVLQIPSNPYQKEAHFLLRWGLKEDSVEKDLPKGPRTYLYTKTPSLAELV